MNHATPPAFSKLRMRSAAAFWIAVGMPLICLCMGCQAPQAPSGSEIVLDSCDQITRTFRGFHRHSFPAGYWTCEGGVLHSVPGKKIDLVTRQKFEDFDFQLDWKVAPGGNSGIFIGVTEAASETYWSGPEMQINDDALNPDGKTPNRSAGALYDLIAPGANKVLKPAGEYNHAEVVSRQGHIEYWLNGAKIVEYDWDSPQIRELIARSKFKDAPHFMKHRNGFIALQSEGDEVWFRNIRIRPFQETRP
jgi:hypothetical protein